MMIEAPTDGGGSTFPVIRITGYDWEDTMSNVETNRSKLDLYPELVVAVRAAENYSVLSKLISILGTLPSPNNWRYTALIGKWDGYQSPELRWELWNKRRKSQRHELLKKIEGIENAEQETT
jgi:hypothetical protein